MKMVMNFKYTGEREENLVDIPKLPGWFVISYKTGIKMHECVFNLNNPP